MSIKLDKLKGMVFTGELDMSKSEEVQASATELRKSLAELDELIAKLEKPKQWEPRKGKYVIQGDSEIVAVSIDHNPVMYVQSGSIRLFKGSAEKARDAMRTHNRLLAYVDEFGGDWEADWSDRWQRKFTVLRCHETEQWSKISYGMQETLGTVYMSLECAQGLIAKLESGEVIL
jgi:hypothetical protein